MGNENWARLTLLLALVLVVLGVGAFLGTGKRSFTALIPALFGLMFGLAGWGLRSDRVRPRANAAALILAILGLAGTLGGVRQLPALVGGAGVERPAAVVVQTIMATLCLAYATVGLARLRFARVSVNAREKQGGSIDA